MQRSALCRSRRELSNAYLLAKFGFDKAENEPFQVCPLSAYRSPRSKLCWGMPLSKIANEWYLFHGTDAETMMKILSGDFVIKTAGSSTGTLYGNGLYFAESITKADEYAKADESGLFRVILCRVTGGNVLYNDEVDPDAEDLRNKCLYGTFHCLYIMRRW